MLERRRSCVCVCACAADLQTAASLPTATCLLLLVPSLTCSRSPAGTASGAIGELRVRVAPVSRGLNAQFRPTCDSAAGLRGLMWAGPQDCGATGGDHDGTQSSAPSNRRRLSCWRRQLTAATRNAASASDWVARCSASWDTLSALNVQSRCRAGGVWADALPVSRWARSSVESIRRHPAVFEFTTDSVPSIGRSSCESVTVGAL